MGDPEQDHQAGLVDRADHLALDGDGRLADPLHDCSHVPILPCGRSSGNRGAATVKCPVSSADLARFVHDVDVDHRCSHRRRDREGGLPGAADHARGAGGDRETLRGRRGRDDPHPHPRRRAPADAGPRPADRDGDRGPGEHRADRPVVDRWCRDGPVRAPAARAGCRAGLLLADDGHGQLRRRRLHEPLAVRHRAVQAQPGARGGAGVRAVRPRARRRAAPAAGQVRPAVRRQGPLRPGDGRPRWHARYDGRTGCRGQRTSRRR